VAYSLNAQGKYAQAEPLWQRAVSGLEAARLRFAATGFERAAAAEFEPHLGWAVCLASLRQPTEAWRAIESGLARGLLDDLTARQVLPSSPEQEQRHRARATRLAELDRQLLPLLAGSALSRDDRARRAALLAERQTLEAELDREAADQARRQVYALGHIQRQLPPDAALVCWVDFATPQKAADPGAWHWVCIVRSAGQPAWECLPGSGSDQAWTAEDDDLPHRLRAALAQRTPEWTALARRLAEQRLGPLEPHLRASGGLPAVTRLIVTPIWPMAGVPVELLTERYQISYAPSGTVFARLAERHRPLGEASLLGLGDPAFVAPDRRPPAALPDHGVLLVKVLPGGNAHQAGIRDGDVLLAYAGTALHGLSDLSIQERGEPVTAEIWHAGQQRQVRLALGKLSVIVHPKPAPMALREQYELDTLLASTRGAAAQPLPGTRWEVGALAALLSAGKAEVLLGSQASEQELDRLAASGRLRSFRLVHFATHGRIEPDSAARSVLLLATDRLPDALEQVRKGLKVYTGRLTAETMSRWQLDADLVTLSACETALGKEAGGEGFLGFAQVLFKAGARALVLSRWKVDDTATALFMRRFYQNLLGKRDGLQAPLGRAAALREAQQWLRALARSEAERLTAQLTGGEVRGTVTPLKPVASQPVVPAGDRPYAHPYYWSAFMLFGDPD
jgi:hypothetical protein